MRNVWIKKGETRSFTGHYEYNKAGKREFHLVSMDGRRKTVKFSSFNKAQKAGWSMHVRA